LMCCTNLMLSVYDPCLSPGFVSTDLQGEVWQARGTHSRLRPGRRSRREGQVRMGMGVQLQLKLHPALNAIGT
jgi:hypothetical protein